LKVLKWLPRSNQALVGPFFSLSPCWRQLGRFRRLLTTAAPFLCRRGLRAWSGIGSNRGRSLAVTTVNRQFVNSKRAWSSCWNSSKETPTAAPGRLPVLRRSGSRRRRVRRPGRLPSRVPSPPSRCAVRFSSGIKCADRNHIKIRGLRIATGNMKLDGPDHE
jgi:hypothetical protein